jgi:hypothetical protein
MTHIEQSPRPSNRQEQCPMEEDLESAYRYLQDTLRITTTSGPDAQNGRIRRTINKFVNTEVTLLRSNLPYEGYDLSSTLSETFPDIKEPLLIITGKGKAKNTNDFNILSVALYENTENGCVRNHIAAIDFYTDTNERSRSYVFTPGKHPRMYVPALVSEDESTKYQKGIVRFLALTSCEVRAREEEQQRKKEIAEKREIFDPNKFKIEYSVYGDITPQNS